MGLFFCGGMIRLCGICLLGFRIGGGGVAGIEGQNRLAKHAAIGFAEHFRRFAAFRTFQHHGVGRHYAGPKIDHYAAEHRDRT